MIRRSKKGSKNRMIRLAIDVNEYLKCAEKAPENTDIDTHTLAIIVSIRSTGSFHLNS